MTSKLKFHRRSDALIRSGIRFRDQLKLMAKPETGFIKSIVIITLTISFLNLGVPLAIQTIVNSIVVRTIIQPLVVMSCILFLSSHSVVSFRRSKHILLKFYSGDFLSAMV